MTARHRARRTGPAIALQARRREGSLPEGLMAGGGADALAALAADLAGDGGRYRQGHPVSAGLRAPRAEPAMAVQDRGRRGTLAQGLSAGSAAEPAGNRGATVEDRP